MTNPKMKDFKAGTKRIEEEHNWGLWVWQCEDGEFLGDNDGNIMSTPGLRFDPVSMKRITDAARHYGFPDGKPVFWQGKRQVNDEEYEEQKARAAAGLTPDPFDMGAIRDEMRAIKYNHGQR